jgi:hypothetical protein
VWNLNGVSFSTIPELKKIINNVLTRAEFYRNDPTGDPHGLSIEDLQQLELLHLQLTSTLYKFYFGDIEAKYQRNEINKEEYNNLNNKLVSELFNDEDIYKYLNN